MLQCRPVSLLEEVLKKKKFPYSGQISDLQVKTYDENVPGHPHHQPGGVLQRQSGVKIINRAHQSWNWIMRTPAWVWISPRWRIWAWTEWCQTGRVWRRWCAGSWWGWEPTGSPGNLSPDAPTHWPENGEGEEKEDEEWVRHNRSLEERCFSTRKWIFPVKQS